MSGETSTQELTSATGRIEPTAADIRDIAKKVVEKIDQHTHHLSELEQSDKSSIEFGFRSGSLSNRIDIIEKLHADLIAKLSRHFPALF